MSPSSCLLKSWPNEPLATVDWDRPAWLGYQPSRPLSPALVGIGAAMAGVARAADRPWLVGAAPPAASARPPTRQAATAATRLRKIQFRARMRQPPERPPRGRHAYFY